MKKNNSGVRKISCKLLVRFIAKDDHIWHFDDSWNIAIGGFTLSNMGGEKLQISFSFEADVVSFGKDGNSILTIPHEDLKELQPYLEKLEVLLDLLTLHSGTPLAIVDGSFVFRGAGYRSSSNPATNINKLVDVSGLEKRFINITNSSTPIANAVRLFRLSQLDKDCNLPIPLKIRNAPTKLMKDQKYGDGYSMYDKESFLPEKLKNKKYF